MLANLWLTSRLLQTTHDRTGESRTGGMCWLRISWSYGHWFSSVDQLCVGLIPHGTPNRFLSARIERERTHYAFIKYLKVLFQNNFDESVHTFDSTLQNQGFDDITTMKTYESRSCGSRCDSWHGGEGEAGVFTSQPRRSVPVVTLVVASNSEYGHNSQVYLRNTLYRFTNLARQRISQHFKIKTYRTTNERGAL